MKNIIRKKKLISSLFLLTFVIMLLYSYNFINHVDPVNPDPRSKEFIVGNDTFAKGGHFIVSNSKCKILNINPFNEVSKTYFNPSQYVPCTDKELLTYLKKFDNITTLNIRRDLVYSYSTSGINCCYSYVTRGYNLDNPDDNIRIWPCKELVTNVTLLEDIVMVKCKDKFNKKQVYENTHTFIDQNKVIKEQVQSNTNKNRPSLLFIGIDSVSRLNLIRQMPKTNEFLHNNGFISLNGYNKIGDNTWPNLMAMMMGLNMSLAEKCLPDVLGKIEKCSLMWKVYKNLGYITAYAEDEPIASTFNFKKKGFMKPPTDYYLRPYFLASDKLKLTKIYGSHYCTGPENTGERMMNIVKDFTNTFKNIPSFGFFWMNVFSHQNVNQPAGMDKKILKFMENLSENGIFNTSIVIFLSDHGVRFGDYRNTFMGWFEERLPYFFASFPTWFVKEYTEEYNNFKSNQNKLTTPYDVYMTLQHILVLSGHNYTITPADSCKTCKSLLEKHPEDRSCEDAEIPQHFCTCKNYEKVTLQNSKKIINFVLDRINNLIIDYPNCVAYSSAKILLSNISINKKENYLLLVLETTPKAMFETTIMFKGEITDGIYSLSGDISRTDLYANHSQCISNAYLKKYCYCK